jgi:hypothetical protein
MWSCAAKPTSEGVKQTQTMISKSQHDPLTRIKAAMAEDMADDSYLPGKKFVEAYGKWANGGWGGIITGMKRWLSRLHLLIIAWYLKT